MVVSRPIADWLRSRYFAGGQTYSGHPLACAAAVASKAALERGLPDDALERRHGVPAAHDHP
jgi:adenosylmethionine-8-amino-7-oxononanoate aminotransferase